jgi:AraC-type DNA-binding domain-containing proteins
MTNFYRTTALTVLGLLCFTFVVMSAAVWFSVQKTSLLPSSKSVFDWYHRTENLGRDNKIIVRNSGERTEEVNFDFVLLEEDPMPYASFIFYLAGPKTVADLVDLSEFSAISFHIRCDPRNVLIFAMYSYVDGVSDIERPETYRVSLDFFPCEAEETEVTFNLREMDSVDWWLERYGVAYTNRASDLTKVHGFAFNNSLQSPKGTPINVVMTEMVLIKDRQYPIYIGLGIAFLAWLIAAYFLVKAYVREQIRFANAQVDANRPLIAYQKLTLTQESDTLEAKLLRHIAVEYVNPDINIESTAASLGTTRTQINKILKSELGLTYTAYINKLRLTEAARLLTEEPNLSVKQIALGVGFANVTYFNLLFKKEYGCAPKSFRTNAPEEEAED